MNESNQPTKEEVEYTEKFISRYTYILTLFRYCYLNAKLSDNKFTKAKFCYKSGISERQFTEYYGTLEGANVIQYNRGWSNGKKHEQPTVCIKSITQWDKCAFHACRKLFDGVDYESNVRSKSNKIQRTTKME